MQSGRNSRITHESKQSFTAWDSLCEKTLKHLFDQWLTSIFKKKMQLGDFDPAQQSQHPSPSH